MSRIVEIKAGITVGEIDFGEGLANGKGGDADG